MRNFISIGSAVAEKIEFLFQKWQNNYLLSHGNFNISLTVSFDQRFSVGCIKWGLPSCPLSITLKGFASKRQWELSELWSTDEGKGCKPFHFIMNLYGCVIWLLHIAKVGYFFSHCLPNMEWLILGLLPYFFYQKSFFFHFLANCFGGPNLYNAVE